VPTLREAGPLILLSVGLGVGLACWLRMLVMPGGFRFVLFAYSVVAINDIGAGVFGELFGRIRPLPRLSPNKTVAGFIGGAASGILVSYLGWFAVPELSLTQITAAGVLLVSSGAAGDLFASGVKRRHGLKDFGTVMGPCGGILDRLDSLLSSGPVFYLYLQLVM
jgi:phosphatidate cytidylyltransferase